LFGTQYDQCSSWVDLVGWPVVHIYVQLSLS
jgi:hypothetical protein